MHVAGTGPLCVNTLIVPISNGECFIVDPAMCGLTGDEKRFLSIISAVGLVPKGVVLTHGHFDHVSGLPFIRKNYPDIPIYIHREDASFIGQESEKKHAGTLSDMGFSKFLPYVTNLPEPTNLLEDGDFIFDQWKVIHTPGHTKGCICLYNEAKKILISGDTIFFHSYGRTDFEGGSEEEIISSIRRIQREVDPETIVYPGHDTCGFKLKNNF